MFGTCVLWWVRFPESENAMTFRFSSPVGEAQARERAKEWAGISRLPKNTEVWPCPNYYRSSDNG
jgi:hypothetical protein